MTPFANDSQALRPHTAASTAGKAQDARGSEAGQQANPTATF